MTNRELAVQYVARNSARGLFKDIGDEREFWGRSPNLYLIIPKFPFDADVSA